jgi:hypothetical protein
VGGTRGRRANLYTFMDDVAGIDDDVLPSFETAGHFHLGAVIAAGLDALHVDLIGIA